jgi:hypothetical protein
LDKFDLVRLRLAVNRSHTIKSVARNPEGGGACTRHLKLIVDNTRLRLAVNNSHVQSRHCANLFSEYAEAKRRWDAVRLTTRDDEVRRAAFAALKAWNPEAAALYDDGERWGFA